MLAQPPTTIYELADIRTRGAALFIDALILSLVASRAFVSAEKPGLLTGFLLGLGYFWFFLAFNAGQTPGKMLMNVRVIKTDGSPIRHSDAVLRYLGYILNDLCFSGWLWALFDNHTQGWHDKIACTYVVKAG